MCHSSMDALDPNLGNVPLYNEEKDPLNFSDAERNRTHVTKVPQGQRISRLHYKCTGYVPLSINAFHAHALAR